MDTKLFECNPLPAPSGEKRDSRLSLSAQSSELLRLQRENALLRKRVTFLETRLAELRGMVHEFLSATDPA